MAAKKESKALKTQFLKSYANWGSLRRACTETKVSWSAVHRWMKRDKKFGDQVAEVKLLVIDEFEVQLRQVALGRLPLTSPQVTALIFALKGNMPEKYRERWGVELTGKDGEAIQVHTIEVVKDYGGD